MPDKKPPFSDDEIIRLFLGIFLALGVFLTGIAALLGVTLWKRPAIIRSVGVRKIIVIAGLFFCLGICTWFLWLDPDPLYQLSFLSEKVILQVQWKHFFRMGALWWCSAMLVLLFSPLILLFKKKAQTLRTKDFKYKVRNFRAIKKAFFESLDVPLGIDVTTGQVVSLFQKKRTSHVLIIGATGTGKTTLMTQFILHAIYHNQPCLIIDPKGEDSTLESIRTLGKLLCPDFQKRFKVFSMSKPEVSASYNPLKHGNANQLKDRIMEALNWSEQYYQSIAGSFLTLFLACTEKLKLNLTLDLISNALIRKELQAKIENQLKDLGLRGDTQADQLFKSLTFLHGKGKAEDLAGLQAQISILNNPTIGHLLSFEKAESEIDLREVLEKNQIAYFQLDTLGNGDTARRLGRMLIEDAKSLASEVYKKTQDKDRKFFPIFIDEFGSFAAKEFIEFLKQSRGAQFGIHLFCQGLEDLDAVSPEFRRQANSNPVTKIGLRLDDNETVNEFCGTAGTVDAQEQSYQTDGKWISFKTGKGNLRETKQMKIEHDVLKNLNIGQAVVVEKSPSQISGIQICLPEILFDEKDHVKK